VGGQVRPQVGRAAPPFVDRAAPVPPRVVQASGRDLDQALVEARVRTPSIRCPFPLPGLVRVPVAAAVKKLDPLRQEWLHGNNRHVDEARAEYSRVNLSSDPIYRYLRITKGGPGGVAGQTSEQDLVDAAWLQRLRRIHQLQSAWWVFATAEHSRFQHALGAMHLAGEWARHLYSSLKVACPDAPSSQLVEEPMRMTALLHDVGYGPFGAFSADNMDYVPRDSYICGVAAGPVDVQRIVHYSFISERGLTLHAHGAEALYMFLNSRLYLYHQVYFHRTVRRIDLQLREVFRPTLELLLGGNPPERVDRFQALTEWSLLSDVDRWAHGDGDPARRELGQAWAAVVARKLKWRLIYQGHTDARDIPPQALSVTRQEFAQQIREHLPAKLGHIEFEV